MHHSSALRLPLVVALVAFATLGSLAGAPPASAAGARVTCTSILGVGDAKNPAAVTGCTDRAKTGGRSKLVTRWPGNGAVGIWTFTWAGTHGTTIARITEKVTKKGHCPKSWIPFTASGKVTGGTGSAQTVIPNGQSVLLHGCANFKTQDARLAKGTKLIF